MVLGNSTISYQDVINAKLRLAGAIKKTPLIQSEILSDAFNAKIFMKAENLQLTGSFKIRGAINFIRQLGEDEKIQGLIAYSSGNHAHAVAKVARIEGLTATIVMPKDAPRIKIEATKKLGAEIVFYDRNSESREDIARGIVEEKGGILIPPFDHSFTIAGQGTVGLEIIDQMAALGEKPDIVLVPCSGGGLIAGIAIAIKHVLPNVELYTVEPENFDDTARSLKNGKIETIAENQRSICDALQVTKPGKLTFSINKILLSGGLTVTDKDILKAMSLAFFKEKLVLEPGGAAAIAAIMAKTIDIEGKNVVVVLSGGNVDPEIYKHSIESL